jgi:hypothetical protein
MTSGFFLYVIWFNPGQSFEYYSLLQHSPTATQNAKASLGLHDYPAAFAQLNAIKHRIEVDGRSRDEVVAKPVELHSPRTRMECSVIAQLLSS